jgi:hypothetical protein
MAKLTPRELLVELEAFTQTAPVLDPALASKISQTARKASVSLEKPADVVARVFLSQVSWPCHFLNAHRLLDNILQSPSN